MNDNTINTEVTMRDDVPTGGAKRFRAGDEILGRYVVESELGQGGMGVVYLCLDKVGGVKVAVKGLPPEVSHNADEMESVRENFQLVSELQHPNIAGVRTLEVDAATGNYYLIMTYARGSSLKHWLRQYGGKAHRGEQLKVLRQIASALDYAHNAEPRHIIHRDIKPENVMVDERGNVSVLDFGLAAQVRSSMSRVSQLVTSRSGTPAYKSPEQWLAQPQRPSSDQYALGVIAYQMYSGELPFDSDDLDILKHAVAFDPVPEIPGEGMDVNAVFSKVLAKKANERFPSCAAFVDALEGKRADDQLRERMWERDRERKIEEEARRKREALQREQALAERKRREEEALAERKRQEEAELISLGPSIENLKQEIKVEYERVSAYLSAHPEYLDSRQVAAGLKGLVYEENPKDLAGAREFHKRLETALLKMKGVIASLDLVVCATVDGEEIDGAAMRYGTRTLDLPVRIKRRQRLSEEEGYQLKYSRGGQEYVGWFSPLRVKQEDCPCVMVPLCKIPTVFEQTKAFIKRNCIRYLWTLLVSLVLAFDISAIVFCVAVGCTRDKDFAVACFGVVAVLAFILLYWRLLRRKMCNVLCGTDDYCTQEHSAFSESELLLDRKVQTASKRSRGAESNDVSYFRIVLKASCCALTVSIFIECIAEMVSGCPVVFGLASAVVTFIISYKKLMRREMWKALISKDKYKDNAIRPAKTKASVAATTPKAIFRWKWLLYIAGMILLACGVCFLVFWLLEGFDGSDSSRAAETSRQCKEALRSEIARERKESARVQSLKAETERLAREKRKAEEARIAAEESARKAKAESERLAEEKNKAEEARIAAENAEAERAAKAEAERMAREKAAAEAERKRQQEEAARQKDAERQLREDARRKEQEEAERKAQEDAKLQELRAEVERLRSSAKSNQEEPARSADQAEERRQVPTSDRTRRKFDGTPTMTLLKFPSKRARSYYERAAESAREGAHNKAKVKADYEKGRTCGGPKWPELEAWLDWWK